MLHLPENTAQGSIANFPVTISHESFEVDLSVNRSFTVIVDFSSPAIVALSQVTSPPITPEGPKTSLPFVLIDK